MPTTTQSLSALESAFEGLYGTQLAGTFAACVLYGVLALQVFIYYMAGPKDPFLLKSLPGWLFILETVHQFVYCVGIYKAAVINFGNPGIITLGIRELFVSTMFQGWITVSAHTFYIYRIWKFGSRPWIVPIICFPLTMTSLGLLLTGNTEGYLYGVTGAPSADPRHQWLTYSVHAINLFLDTVFASAMVWLLKKHGSSAFEKTSHMVNRLIILIINTGLATAVVTLATILLLRAQEHSLNFVLLNVLISPLYCNCVLANLNSRDYVRGRPERFGGRSGGNGRSISTAELGPITFGNPHKTDSVPSTRPGEEGEGDSELASTVNRDGNGRASMVATVLPNQASDSSSIS